MKSIRVISFPMEQGNITINPLNTIKFIFDDNGDENIQIRFDNLEKRLYVSGSSPIKIGLSGGCNSCNIELVDFE